MLRPRLSGLAPALVFLSAFLTACAARGPSYEEVISTATPLNRDDLRLVFLRPKDRDDGGNGGAATIRIDEEKVGGLAYGGFFFVDLPSGAHSLEVSGRYRTFGSCQLELTAMTGATVYVDVGPRTAYMVASLVGTVVGGAAGFAVVPNSEIGLETLPVEMIVNEGTVALAAGSVAGEAVAVKIEGSGKPCSGPYQIVPMSEQDAVARVQGLVWSK